MITYFEACLRCLQCGAESTDQMYTKLLDYPGTMILHVGDQPDVDPSDYERAFQVLRERRPDEPFRVLLPWRCGYCQWGGWALVTVTEDGRVDAIEAIPLDRSTVRRAQFIADDLVEYFERVTGLDLYEQDEAGAWHRRPDFVALFVAALPEPPGQAPSFEGL